MSICLCMVVKNESALIRETLQSAKPFIDRWSILDTGSTDGTPDIIFKELGEKIGTFAHAKWVDYGTTRTAAINLAKRSRCDQLLILDADEKLIVPPDFDFASLDPEGSFWLTVKYGGMSYSRPSLLNAKHNWRYVGVTHEYLMADPMPPAVLLPVIIQTHPTRCTKSVERCREDINILYKGLAEEPHNSRYVFYLAQSYRDAGDLNGALLHYKRRASMRDTWYEETYCAQFQVAQLMERLGFSRGDIIDAYLKAYNMNPERSEPLGALARYLRIAGDFHSAYMFADKASAMQRSNQLLFVEDSFYQWRNQDELSISAYWTDRYQICVNLCDLLLKSGNLPLTEVNRVLDNRQHAVNRLKEGK